MFLFTKGTSPIAYWDAVRALVAQNPGIFAANYNDPPHPPPNIAASQWCANEDTDAYNGEGLKNRIIWILNGQAGNPNDIPARVMLDELKANSLEKVARCAQLMRGQGYANRWGAYLVSIITNGGLSALNAKPAGWPAGLNGAIDELLDSDAIIACEFYVPNAKWTTDAELLQRFLGNDLGVEPEHQFKWLVDRKAARNSSSHLTVVFKVSRADNNPATEYPSPDRIEQFVRVWMRNTYLREFTPHSRGGVGAWVWDDLKLGNDYVDSGWLDAWNYYVRDAPVTPPVRTYTRYTAPTSSPYGPTGAITFNPPTHYGLFRTGSALQLEHKYVDLNAAGTEVQWSNWINMGQPPAGCWSDPTAASWGVGRIDLFTTTYDSTIPAFPLYHRSYEGGTWSGWENLGGSVASGAGAVSWYPGWIFAYVVAFDLNVYQKYWAANQWSGWESLGQPTGGATSSPSAISWGYPHLNVYVRGSDNGLWHRSLTLPNGWTPWESLGGGLASAPGACTWGTGHVSVFVRGTDDNLYHKMHYGGVWAPWQSLGQPPGGVQSAPSAVTKMPGDHSGTPADIRVFVRGTTGQVWVLPWDPSRGWGQWTIERVGW